MNFKLVKLGDFIKQIRGVSYKKSDIYTNLNEKSIELLRANNIKDSNLVLDDIVYVDKSKVKKEQILRKGDILICASSGSKHLVGKSVLIKEDTNFTFGAFCKVIRTENISSRFLEYFFQSQEYRNFINQVVSGTNINNIKNEHIDNIMIPLPPLNEQQRIVNVIKSLFAKLDRAKELIENTLAQFEQNKIAILHKAFTGELTVKWRKENNIDLSSWQDYQLRDICEKITDGTHQTPKYTDDGGYIFLSSKNVKSGKIDWKNIKYIPKDLHDILYERIAPQRDDILLAKNGTTGVAAIVDRDIIFDIYVSLALLRVNKKYILPRFLLYAIGSPIIKNYFDSNLKGIGVPNLHLKYIREATISVPTIEEQQEIVNILDKLLAKYNKIKNLEQQLEKMELLKKAILAKAFRGELGTNNPDEESAEKLLTEILAEKEN